MTAVRVMSKVKTIRKTLADGTVKLYHYEVGPTKPPERKSRFPEGSVGAVLAEFRGSPIYVTKAVRTKKNYDLHLSEWEDFADQPISAIRRQHVLRMRDHIQLTRGNGAATIFRDVSAVLFKFALDRGYLEANPARDLEPIGLGSWPAWTMADAELALAKLPGHLAEVITLAMWTGQRRSDLIKMKWADIDRRVPGTIYVSQTKFETSEGSRVELDIPIAPVLAEALAAWKRKRTRAGKPPAPGDTILLSVEGRPYDDSLSGQMAEAMRSLNRNGLNIHGLRKMCAANLADMHCSPHEIMAITGHKTLAMVEHYTKTANLQRLGVTAMEKLTGQAGKTTRKPRLGN